MGNFKNNYIEGVFGILLIISSYYAIKTAQKMNYNKKILSTMQSQLVLEALKEQEKIEFEIEEKKIKASLNKLQNELLNAGCEILELKKQDKQLIAIIKADKKAQEQLAYIKNAKIEVIEPGVLKILIEKIESKAQQITFKLNAICFYGANDWEVFLNDSVYTNKNNIISHNCYISKVQYDFIEIVYDGEKILLLL